MRARRTRSAGLRATITKLGRGSPWVWSNRVMTWLRIITSLVAIMCLVIAIMEAVR